MITNHGKQQHVPTLAQKHKAGGFPIGTNTADQLISICILAFLYRLSVISMPFFEYISTSRKKNLKKYRKTWDIISILSSLSLLKSSPYPTSSRPLPKIHLQPLAAGGSWLLLGVTCRRPPGLKIYQGKPTGNGRSLPHLPGKRPAGIRWWKYLGNLWRKLLSAPACLVFVLLAEYFLKPLILSSLKKSGRSLWANEFHLLRWNRQRFGSYECGPKEYRSKNVSGLRGVRTTSFHSSAT